MTDPLNATHRLQDAIDDEDVAADNETGWRMALDKLAALVESGFGKEQP